MKNYGVRHPSQSQDIKKLKEETCLKNYGVRHPSQSQEIHKKQYSGRILKHHESGLYYRGSYEKDFINYCINKQIKIENFDGNIDYLYKGKRKNIFQIFFLEIKI